MNLLAMCRSIGLLSISMAIAGDFNGDGRINCHLANSNSFNVSILLGDGIGGFSLATNFGAGGFPASLVVGDFNSDGKQDIASASVNSGLFILLRDCTISGTVVYGNSVGSPSTRYVSNVQVNAAGSPPASATTVGEGNLQARSAACGAIRG